jgi:hypothetical protein
MQWCAVPAVLAAAHVLLWPLASLSTGELKARGTYFEENALLPNSAPPTFTFAGTHQPATELHGAKAPAGGEANGSEEGSEEGAEEEVCSSLARQGLPCFAFGPSLVYSVARPTFMDDGKELLVLLALPPLLRRNGGSGSESGGGGLSEPGSGSGGCRSAGGAELFAPLLGHLRRSRWLAKTVVLLLPGEQCTFCNPSPVLLRCSYLQLATKGWPLFVSCYTITHGAHGSFFVCVFVQALLCGVDAQTGRSVHIRHACCMAPDNVPAQSGLRRATGRPPARAERPTPPRKPGSTPTPPATPAPQPPEALGTTAAAAAAAAAIIFFLCPGPSARP